VRADAATVDHHHVEQDGTQRAIDHVRDPVTEGKKLKLVKKKK